MNTTRAKQGAKHMPTYSSSVLEADRMNEDEYDDVWPARPPSSVRRYQGQADVRTETGRVPDVQDRTSRRGHVRLAGERHPIPPRRTTSQKHVPALQTSVESIKGNVQGAGTQQPRRSWPGQQKSQRRFHWLFFVGLATLIMILGWITLSALGSWWQTTQDDWRYGRPRTFQIDQVVGHHDSPQNPSHFIAINLNRRIIVIEISGGDVSKSVMFSGPTLIGPGQDLTPVTLTFRDVNHDGKLDMLVNIQDTSLVFLNESGTFVSTPPSQTGGS